MREIDKIDKIDWYKIGILIVIALSCLSALQALPQNTGIKAGGTVTESGIRPKAVKLYWKAARELHQGHAASAENDAIRALRIDKTFADAAELERHHDLPAFESRFRHSKLHSAGRL